MTAFQEHPCPNCGSELNYDAEKNDLKCLHCGTVFPIEQSTEVLDEKNIGIFFDAARSPIAATCAVVYKCAKCGQETEAANDIAFFECRNCGNNVLNPQAYGTRSIVPAGIIPFKISRQRALDIFTGWIGKGFWNDSDLKKLSLTDKLVGHYVPFFTFDCLTRNHWQGYSGRYYYETITTTNAKGERVSQSVQRTRWIYRNGEFERFFDDVLICGNKTIPQQQVNAVYPFYLNDLVIFKGEYLLGWEAKAYDRELSETYNLARQTIDQRVKEEAAGYLAEDTYKDLQVSSRYFNETFKQVILPVWLCRYLFKGKSYYFIINGQTGAIDGDKPLSVSKIAAAVIIVLAVILLIYFLSAG